MRAIWRSLAVAALAAIGASALHAAPADEFYKGKQIVLILSTDVGGGYAASANAIIPYLSANIPGRPRIIMQNMPGAGGVRAMNYMYSAAPKDGTRIALVQAMSPYAPLFGVDAAKYDPRQMHWIGSLEKSTGICVAWSTSGIRTWQDVFAKEFVVGASGAGSQMETLPHMVNKLFGTKIKVVSGYKGGNDVFLAMERGEVDGICESLDSVIDKRPEWISTKKVLVLFQGGAAPNPEIKDVPFILDFARNEEEKQAMLFLYGGQGIGRPFVAPPDLPADRLKMLREAFNKTMRDPEFIADVKKEKLDLEPEDGEHLAALIAKMYQTPKAVVEKVSALLKSK
jgi:tripartite-type tricarboxylate transporter receptor subunit TctC